MSTRRTFVKEAVTGALLLGAGSRLGLAKPSTPQTAGKSKVVIASDASVFDAVHQLIPARVEALLDRAIVSYTGAKTPVEGWKHIVGSAKTVGLKTNGLGGRGISTHAVLAYAVADRLQKAGIAAGNIIIWDRNARDLQACGLNIATATNAVRCFGSDVSGFEDQPEAWGSARIRLSKILTRECELVIGLPILKDHELAGVTFAMKNMYGVVDRPQSLHAAGCNPAVADLNCIPAVRQKVRFTIGDALSSVYDGGPSFRPERLWYPNSLIVGEDRVAIDYTAWQMLERKRAEAGIRTLEAAGRPPHYIATAADAQHALGTNDPARMQLVEA